MTAALIAAVLLSQAYARPRPPAELDGTIAGRVCEDVDGDGRCGEDEPGIARVRLVLETGEEVFTDVDGRYHFAAVDARVPSAANGGRLLFGRHRLKVDRRTLVAGAVIAEDSVTLELSMGAVVRHDFAIELAREKTQPISTAPTAPPAATVKNGEIDFLLSGTSAPGDAVQVGEAQTTAGPDGKYSLWVKLKPGRNVIAIQLRSPGGEERLYRQQIDVVRQASTMLIVPRAPVLEATVHLPSTKTEKAQAGRTALRVQAAPGTRIHGPHGEVVVRQGGVAEVPVELAPGQNEVKLAITPPGEATHEQALSIQAAAAPFVVGLLEIEGAYDVHTHGLRLFGRGAAHGEATLWGWNVAGELSLDDLDVQAAHALGAHVLGYARRPETPERALDPDRYPFVFGDDSVASVPNAAQGRLRISARNDRWGLLAFGSERAQLAGTEVGRYQREIFGPSADLKLVQSAPFKLELRAFDGTALADPTRALATAPVHEEFLATGGSLYYLHEGAIAEGSEVVTVELREGLDGVPLAQRHLVRGRDYEIDYGQGRILLARPLSFAAVGSVLPAGALSAGAAEVLVVDASRLSFSGESPALTGGELTATLGPVDLRAGGVDQREPDGYRMVRANVGIPLGPLTLWAEGAVSRNHALLPGDLARSDDGGLFFASAPLNPDSKGEAFTIRLKGPGVLPGGSFDASFRRRTPGFSDDAHDEITGSRQLYLRAEQPIGSVRLSALVDDYRGEDPRDPYGTVAIDGRTVGGSVGWQGERLSLSAQVKDARLTAPPRVGDPEVEGGRTSVGVAARYKVSETLSVLASDEQVVSQRGSGLGAADDSFAKAGVAVSLPRTDVELEGGWGKHLGPQVLGRAQVKDGSETYYGSYSVDVDGPDYGTARSVSGVSSKLSDRSSVFVEDVAAHDANTVRLSKAVGFSEELGGGLSVSARYERGAHSVLDSLPSLRRDAAGVSAQWLHGWLKAYVRAELRHDRGIPLLGPPVPVDFTQRLLSGAIEADLRDDLRASARINFGDTYDAPGVRLARFLEGGAGLAWTHAPWLVLLRYSVQRSLSPPPSVDPERTLQIFSLLPSVDLGPRFTLGAGVNAALSGEVGKESQWIFSGSVRPAVRVWRGVELAVEVARRSASLDGGALTAVRGEVGYRFGPMALLAAGDTAIGYSGLGLSPTGSGDEDRLYLRAELGI